MELNIGTNIKRLRLERGMTQEQLADLLTVSTAAVSKWEAKNTYPDITMLFPIAEIFGVSIDDLLGYDEARAKENVEKILAEYRELNLAGRFKEARKLIESARKQYPHNYYVMNKYMWDKAEGTSGNQAEVLLKNKDEFLQICNTILEGCTVESIRIEAINMKAKISHAEGDTDAAMRLLDELPKIPNQYKKEALFSKGTPEFAYWNKKNCFGLMDDFAVKLARDARFDSSLTVDEKIQKLEEIAESFAEMSKKPHLELFCIGEASVRTQCAGMLTAENTEIENVIRCRENQFAAMAKVMELAEREEVLADTVLNAFGTSDIIGWEVERLLNSPHKQFANLRKYGEYTVMLAKYSKNDQSEN